MKTTTRALFFICAALATTSCDCGSVTDSTPLEGNLCEVSLRSRSTGFTVEMTLSCAGDDHTDCYTIEELTCGGDDIELTEPVAIEGCPEAGEYCISDCVADLAGSNGHVWDTPELLEIDGCNVYTDD